MSERSSQALIKRGIEAYKARLLSHKHCTKMIRMKSVAFLLQFKQLHSALALHFLHSFDESIFWCSPNICIRRHR